MTSRNSNPKHKEKAQKHKEKAQRNTPIIEFIFNFPDSFLYIFWIFLYQNVENNVLNLFRFFLDFFSC